MTCFGFSRSLSLIRGGGVIITTPSTIKILCPKAAHFSKPNTSQLSSCFDERSKKRGFSCEWRGGLMVSVLDSGTSGPGSSPGGRFSKVPKCFRVRNAVAKSQTL